MSNIFKSVDSAGMGIAITGATEGSVLFAGVGGILQQDNANLFWDNTNNRLGIGTASPATRLELSSTVAGTGVDGLVVGQTNSSLAITHRSRFYTQQQGGGIGRTLFYAASNTTGSTQGQFDVLTEDGANFLVSIGSNVTGTNTLGLYDIAGALTNQINSNGNSYFNGGNVGIGTTSPSYSLHVVKTHAAQSRIQLVNASTSDGALAANIIVADGNRYIGFFQYGSGNTGSSSGISNASLAMLQTGGGATGSEHLLIDAAKSTANIYFATAGVVKQTITSAGNVGIGTTAPSAQLHIVAGAAGTVGSIFKGAASQTADLLQVQNSSATVLSRINATGQFGFGIAPTYPIHISNVLTGITTATYGEFIDHDITATADVTSDTSALGATVRFRGSVTQTDANKGVTALTLSAFNSNTATIARLSGTRYDVRNLSTGTVTHMAANYVNTMANSGGGTVTNTYGINIADQTVGTNNYGVASAISSGSNKYNIYASGTAQNYFAGRVGIGNAVPDQLITLDSTGSSFMSFKTSGSTKAFYGVSASADDPIVGMTAGDLGFRVQGNDIYFSADSGASGQLVIKNSGSVGIGTSSPNANAILDLTSTTKAFMPPRMTTAQKNAIASPTEGMMVWDTSLKVLAVYNGTSWQAVTAV